MHRLKQLHFIVIILALLLLPGAAAAQEDDDGLTLTARAGFDGAYHGDDWVPITVRAANQGPDIEGQLRVVVDRGGGNDVVYTAPISLPNRSDKSTTLYVHVPGFSNALTVELRDARGRLLREIETNNLDRLTAEEPLYGVVSSEPGVWTFLEQVAPAGVNAAAALLEPQDLPEAPAAWNVLDVLILHNVDSARLSGAQLDALRAWVGLGGQLVLTGGSGWQETTAAFDDLLPVAVDGVASVDDLPALEARAGEPFRDPGPYLVSASTLRSGEVLLRDGDLPLLTRRPFGRGAVYFLALDPALAPLVDWRGSQQLWAEIGANIPTDPSWARGPQNPYSAVGALSGLPALSLPSSLALLFFLGLYVVIVGPVNYFVLGRLGRRELAWLTIPGLVLLFSGLAYAGGFRLRGNEVVLNQVSITYGAIDGAQGRSVTLLGIFSPRRAAYDVQLPAASLVRPFSRDFGDMSGAGSEEAISRGADVVLQDVRVDVSGMETYVAESYRPLPPIQGSAQMLLDGADVRIQVDLQNNGDFALQNAGILAGNAYIDLGDVAPGARATQDYTVTGGLSSALTGAPTSYPTTQPISAHYDKILGTGDFYSDREVNARFQLLESMQNYSGAPVPANTTTGISRGVLTLIAWSDQPQLDVTIPQLDSVEHQNTTLYFLEMPIENVIAGGENVSVPPALLEWEIESQSGAFVTSINNFYLPPGRLDITYTPWPTFRDMDVTGMQINLAGADPTAPVPDLYLWNWQQEVWSQVPNAVWGNIGIGAYDAFIGPQNSTRLRLDNTSPQGGVTVEAVYPVLTGDVE